MSGIHLSLPPSGTFAVSDGEVGLNVFDLHLHEFMLQYTKMGM